MSDSGPLATDRRSCLFEFYREPGSPAGHILAQVVFWKQGKKQHFKLTAVSQDGAWRCTDTQIGFMLFERQTGLVLLVGNKPVNWQLSFECTLRNVI